MEVFLPVFHFISIFVLFALLFAEFFILRLPMSSDLVRSIARLDLLYGIFSLVVIISGVLRVVGGSLGAGYYAGSTAFWVKMGLFMLVGLLSIAPSIRFFRWNRTLKAGGELPTGDEVKKARLFVHMELGLFVLIPIFAVLMAAD